MNVTALRSSLVCLLLVACSGAEPAAPAREPEPAPAAQPAEPAQPAAEPAAKDEHAAHAAAAADASFVPAPEGARAFFVAPKDGEKVVGPLEAGVVSVKVQMGAEGIAIKEAGALEAGTGHHHILIDAEPMTAGLVVPKDDTHLHFGKGQTEAQLQLKPGTHKLTLQVADGLHRSYGPALAQTITIDVQPAGSVGATAP